MIDERECSVTIRVLRETRKHLRYIRAETDESIMSVVGRLVAAEWAQIAEQLKKEKEGADGNSKDSKV